MSGTPPRDPLRSWLDARYPGATIDALAGDASTRRFFRLHPAAGPTLVVMDYGGPTGGETDDLRMGGIFLEAGLPVARPCEFDPEVGCLVTTDLGDRSLEAAVQELGPPDPRTPAPLLLEAVELAAAISARGTPVLARSARASGPALDASRFRFEMDFFLEHFVQGLRGAAVPAGLRDALHALAERAAQQGPRVLCHRDFHSRNLMVLADGGLGMVDIQDARWGPDSYDLASLLRDAYIEVPEGWIEPLTDRFLGALDEPPDRDAFLRRFHEVAVERMIKALGSFGYLTRAKATDRYRPSIPPTLARLGRVLPRSATTAPIGEILERSGLLDGAA